MTGERKIYLLDPHEYSPETIAVAFAKTSRSPEGFKEIADDLNDTKSAEFHEKWVVGYGHASVAEHAVLHIAMENVSRLAVETIESNRLASYTEKSSRYQKWSTDAYHIPAEIRKSGLEPQFLKVASLLFDTYAVAMEASRQLIRERFPQKPDESDAAWDRRIRSRYADACRFLLPAASLANLGMTANARVLEGMIRKMLSSPLQEVREIGAQVKQAALAEVPTLIKYADANPYLVDVQEQLAADTAMLGKLHFEKPAACTLLDWHRDGEEQVVAAVLYRYMNAPLEVVNKQVNDLSSQQKRKVLDYVLGSAGKHDTPLRELEHITYTFDLVLDQGAYFEVKRHRMMTQTVQELGCNLGYSIPVLLREAGVEQNYRHAMDAAAELNRKLQSACGPAAAYIVPNGFNRRLLITLNFREAFTFCALRSASNAHFSVRIVAQQIADEIRRVHPLLGSYLPVNPDETWQSILEQYFIPA